MYLGPLELNVKKTDYLRHLPWDSEEEFKRDLERAWTEMKQEGLRKGILTLREDGAIVGHGHPDRWFDAVESKSK
jgi:hypothetical protein